MDDVPHSIRQNFAAAQRATVRRQALDDVPFSVRRNLAATQLAVPEAPVDPEMTRSPPPEPKRPRGDEEDALEAQSGAQASQDKRSSREHTWCLEAACVETDFVKNGVRRASGKCV